MGYKSMVGERVGVSENESTQMILLLSLCLLPLSSPLLLIDPRSACFPIQSLSLALQRQCRRNTSERASGRGQDSLSNYKYITMRASSGTVIAFNSTTAVITSPPYSTVKSSLHKSGLTSLARTQGVIRA